MTPAGLQGSKIRVSVTKMPSGMWRCTVALPSGAHAHTERRTWDDAWDARREVYRELTEAADVRRTEAA